MKKFTFVAAAVAASLAASSAAFALAPADDSIAANYDVRLVISGSSAFQAALENELAKTGTGTNASGICNNVSTGVTYNKYTTQSGGPGLSAYSCNLLPNVITGSTGGEKALIYFRTEGGSIYGVTPIARTSTTPLRLVVNSGCSTPAAGATGICTVTGYNAVQDTVTGGNATPATSQLGISDEEPNVFQGENYPDNLTAAKLQPVLSGAERSTLTGASKALIGQIFGVYINNSGGSAAQTELANVTSLSRTTISAIFQGLYTDWNQVPKNDGSNTPVVSSTLPIVLCKRESGSGTQVAASIFFNNYGCGSNFSFANTANPGNLTDANGNSFVVENNATGAMRTCISSNGGLANTGTYGAGPFGAIGFIVSEADAAGRKQIKIDQQGVAGGNNLQAVAAASDYQFWYEGTANFGAAYTAAPAATKNLADKLVGVLQKQATGPNSAAVLALPAFNAPSFPISTPAGKAPIAIATHKKNSCLPLVNQN